MLTDTGHDVAPLPGEQLTALLLEGHARIRSFVALAASLAGDGAGTEQEVAEAAARVARYFLDAFPLHLEDEELSLLPRLAGRDRDVDAALVAMHRDHAHHGLPVDRVVSLCRALTRAPERRAELAPALAVATCALGDHLASHLAVEEEVVFPAVRRHLTLEAQVDVLFEVRERRAPRPRQSSR